MKQPRLAHLALIAAAAVLLLAGCDERVIAVTGTDLPFTVYGLLSPDLDVQKVLVYPIEETLRSRSTDALDAAVRSVDLTTGEERIWTDSLVVGSDGLYEHIYQARFRAQASHTYRITVTRSDGSVTGVETTVPPPTTVTSGMPRVFPGVVTLPVRVEGGAPRIHHVLVTYYATFHAILGGAVALEVPVNYDGEQVRVDGRWEVPLDLRRDYRTIERAGSGLDPARGIRLNFIGIQLVVASDDWDPPGGRFDAEVIVQPGVMSNVENGYGFVAAGYRHDVRLDPPDGETLRAAGFTPAGE